MTCVENTSYADSQFIENTKSTVLTILNENTGVFWSTLAVKLNLPDLNSLLAECVHISGLAVCRTNMIKAGTASDSILHHKTCLYVHV